MPGVRGLPSVTEVIRACGLSREYPDTPDMQRRRDLGTALHLAIAYHHAGTLDEATVHPLIRPGFDAYLKFLAEFGHVPLYSELELEHPYGFVGHLDRVGDMLHDAVELVDWKRTTNVDLVTGRLQMAGYRLLWEHNHPDRLVKRCLIVALSPGGGVYRAHDVTDDYSMSVFLAAVVVYHARKEMKR